MAQQHKRKRSGSSRPSMAAAAVCSACVMLLSPNVAMAQIGDAANDPHHQTASSAIRRTRNLRGETASNTNTAASPQQQQTQSASPNNNNPSEGNNNNNNINVNLLIKFKDNSYRTRHLDKSSNVDHWQNHAKTISTISKARHIASVGIDATELPLVLQEMEADDLVEYFEEDFPVHKIPYTSQQYPINIQSPDDDDDSRRHLNTRQNNYHNNRTLIETQQYGLKQIQAPSVWEITNANPNKYPNTPIQVCIIDTGFDGSHEDLPKEGVTGTNTGYGNPLKDGDGHGTHCAGVIGALGGNDRGIMGVNPNPTKFRFHIAKALNDDGLGTASSVLKGIEGCISSGSKVISMSLGGGPKSSIFREIYEDAYNRGVLVFAAAGNLGLMQNDYPASYPHVVSVGAVDKRGTRADFSNWNTQLEMMGPGVDIISTYPGNGYGMLNGTSMATPYVAGVAALVWGYFPQCSNQQIRNVLAVTAKNLVQSGNVRCNRKVGFGLVQAKDAFDLLDTYGCAAGGEDLNPLSEGGVGGCDQPLVDVSTLVPRGNNNGGNNIQPAQFAGSSNQCQKLFLRLLTDDYAYELAWELKDLATGEVINSGPPDNRNFEDKTVYNGPVSGCLEPGNYEFSISDIFGDGLNPPGYYVITLDGKTMKQGGKFGAKEATSFTISDTSAQIPDTSAQPPGWTSLLDEDFNNGFGSFTDGGENAMYLNSKFGRTGLAMVKKGTANYSGSSITSKNIRLNNRGFTKFKVIFSFFANNGMDSDDRFCLDYAANGASTWSRAKCWRTDRDFATGEWNDNVSWTFEPTAGTVNSIRVRLRGFSSGNFDRVFIDKVQLLGKAELTR